MEGVAYHVNALCHERKLSLHEFSHLLACIVAFDHTEEIFLLDLPRFSFIAYAPDCAHFYVVAHEGFLESKNLVAAHPRYVAFVNLGRLVR